MTDAGNDRGLCTGDLASQRQRVRLWDETVLAARQNQRRRRDRAELKLDRPGKDRGAPLILFLGARAAGEAAHDFRMGHKVIGRVEILGEFGCQLRQATAERRDLRKFLRIDRR